MKFFSSARQAMFNGAPSTPPATPTPILTAPEPDDFQSDTSGLAVTLSGTSAGGACIAVGGVPAVSWVGHINNWGNDGVQRLKPLSDRLAVQGEQAHFWSLYIHGTDGDPELVAKLGSMAGTVSMARHVFSEWVLCSWVLERLQTKQPVSAEHIRVLLRGVFEVTAGHATAETFFTTSVERTMPFEAEAD